MKGTAVSTEAVTSREDDVVESARAFIKALRGIRTYNGNQKAKVTFMFQRSIEESVKFDLNLLLKLQAAVDRLPAEGDQG